jgi:sulfite reductase (NADPH) hemoprotein beta-component
VPAVIEALLETYRIHRQATEHFIDTARRIGPEPFKRAANAARMSDLNEGEDVLHNPADYARNAEEA